MGEEKKHEETHFHDAVSAAYEKKAPDLGKSLNVLVVGKVSSGKSSLINALLRRTRETRVAAVSAPSGTTTAVKVMRLDEHVCIIDTPGLDDIESANSEVTKGMLKGLDVGVLVVTGAADASQKAHLERLRACCSRVFVVLNKIDEWDRHTPSALQQVAEQWRAALAVDRIYPTCCFGFDPDTRPGVALDIRGVDELRNDLEVFLEGEGKALLLARQMGEKRSYALKIIGSALIAVAGEAFVPGSTIYITATQAVTITALYYLYTGRVLSKTNSLALLPTFAAENIGTTLFLWAKSVLPPTGIVDAAAAGVAVTVTAAMLLTVNSLLASGAELHEKAKLRSRYNEIQRALKFAVTGATWTELESGTFWQKVIHDLMYA